MDTEPRAHAPATLIAKRSIEQLEDRELSIALRQLEDNFEKTGVQKNGIARRIYDAVFPRRDITGYMGFSRFCSMFYFEGAKRFMKTYHKKVRK